MTLSAADGAYSYKCAPAPKPSRLPSSLLCFSHLRWDFVYQRPQHLMSRFARDTTVYFVEEPLFGGSRAQFVVQRKGPNLHVVTPQLPDDTLEDENDFLLRNLIDGFLATRSLRDTAFWYYSPLALAWTGHLNPAVTIYDCVEALPANARHRQMEQNLLSRSEIVFTDGQSLYDTKKSRHINIHAFPSSIDAAHFRKARNGIQEPADYQHFTGPRLGFYGVVDERFDAQLLAALAEQRPNWQFIIVGPVLMADPSVLPKAANIHYLGARSYEELPAHLKGWDIAMMPFALNEATRFISPTKTPEYLAGGKPVISSPIYDVQHPYADQGLVHIASGPEEWLRTAEEILSRRHAQEEFLQRVDSFLGTRSWDESYGAMKSLILATMGRDN